MQESRPRLIIDMMPAILYVDGPQIGWRADMGHGWWLMWGLGARLGASRGATAGQNIHAGPTPHSYLSTRCCAGVDNIIASSILAVISMLWEGCLQHGLSLPISKFYLRASAWTGSRKGCWKHS